MAASPQPVQVLSVEAKLVVLGASGVGKTSLLSRFLHPDKPLGETTSTIGASFVTKRLVEDTTGTIVRLQLWDTGGQERYRSIAPIFYRGAQAALLVYDVCDEKSFAEMTDWLRELKSKATAPGDDLIVHVVGTKCDLVAEDPSRRQVPFERAVAFVAQQLAGVTLSSSAPSYSSPSSKRSSGHWMLEEGWDSVNEVNAKDGEGLDEVFRVLARKLVDRQVRRDVKSTNAPSTPAVGSDAGVDYFNGTHGTGSFRLGHGDKRKSWLGLPSVSLEAAMTPSFINTDPEVARARGRCC